MQPIGFAEAHLEHNYCRDSANEYPSSDHPTEYLWCYTEDPDVRWEFCYVPQCGEFYTAKELTCTSRESSFYI